MIISPNFERQLVIDKLGDGYWIEAFKSTDDGRADIVGDGLCLGEVTLYKNPTCKKTWP